MKDEKRNMQEPTGKGIVCRIRAWFAILCSAECQDPVLRELVVTCYDC
jgi:hypothetical protein